VKVAIEKLTWHDASVDTAHYDKTARQLVWQVDVFRWDIQEDGDAEPGQVIFEGVEHIEAFHDLVGELSPEPSFWDVYDGSFERIEGLLRCKFIIYVPHRLNELGGQGYGELIVTCQNAWYTSSHENTL